MKKLLLVCFIVGEVIVAGYGEPDTPSLLNETKKEILLKGSFYEKLASSLTLSPIKATISSFSLDATFLQDLGAIDVIVYAESGEIVNEEIINTSAQQYLSIDVSAWDCGTYQIRFVNSTGQYMYGSFDIE